MGRFGTLDMMRGLAAIAVVTYHVDKVNPLGYLAVDLFFILSGFVLCHAYGGKFSFADFMRIRVVRLYPMFFMGALIGLALRGGNPLQLAMVPDWTGEALFPSNGPLWSVLFEMIASLGFILFYRFGWKAWFALWFMSGGMWVTAVAAHDVASIGAEWAWVHFGLARMTFAFTTGVALHWLFRRYGSRVETNWAWAVCAVPVAVTFLPSVPLWVSLFFILPSTVWLGAVYELPQQGFAKLSGDISYPLYAIHMPLVALGGWVAVPFVLVASWALDRWYDRPVRKWLNQPRGKASSEAVKPAV